MAVRCVKSWRLFLGWVCFAGASMLVTAPALSSELPEILQKMRTADEQLSYQGIFVLRKADQLMAMRVEHAADDRGVWESLESLNGESRKVVRINEEVVSVYPERKLFIESRNRDRASLHPTLPQNLDKLKQHYRIERLSDDRIAGHKAVVLDVRPTDKNRYGYRYWLDTSTGVLLRCDLINEQDHVVEQMMFTSLEYLDDVPDVAFNKTRPEGFTHRKLDEGRQYNKEADWQVAKLPEGFMLTHSSVRNRDDAETVHMIYSDGLASVSVFIEQGNGHNKHLDGASSMGALNAYGRRLDDHFITVMGEVPEQTVMQMARSTRPIE